MAPVTLLTITDSNTSGFPAGATRTYDPTTVGSFTTSPALDPVDNGALLLPEQIYPLEFYYLGAYVDWTASDPANGQIAESDDVGTNNNNSLVTTEASVQIGRP